MASYCRSLVKPSVAGLTVAPPPTLPSPLQVAGYTHQRRDVERKGRVLTVSLFAVYLEGGVTGVIAPPQTEAHFVWPLPGALRVLPPPAPACSSPGGLHLPDPGPLPRSSSRPCCRSELASLCGPVQPSLSEAEYSPPWCWRPWCCCCSVDCRCRLVSPAWDRDLSRLPPAPPLGWLLLLLLFVLASLSLWCWRLDSLSTPPVPGHVLPSTVGVASPLPSALPPPPLSELLASFNQSVN